MARLIDESEYEKMIRDESKRNPVIAAALLRAYQLLHDAPAVETEAGVVRHEHWRFRKVADGHHQYSCSACNDSFGFKGIECDMPSKRTVLDHYKFCRNCGARMDGERGGGEG